MTLENLQRLILTDRSAMYALAAVRDVGPEGAYIAAGFVRNRYWDSLYTSISDAPSSDIDVVYYDADYHLKTHDLAYEASLKIVLPDTDWQVRNQARMHKFGGYPPFSSLEEGLRHWAETATGIGVRLNASDELEWISAYGFDDLFDHILRITPPMKANDLAGFEKRLTQKGWQTRWPDLTVVRD